MEFSRQEYWSGLPFPSPGNVPNPGIKPRSPTLQADSLPTEPPEKPTWGHRSIIIQNKQANSKRELDLWYWGWKLRGGELDEGNPKVLILKRTAVTKQENQVMKLKNGLRS